MRPRVSCPHHYVLMMSWLLLNSMVLLELFGLRLKLYSLWNNLEQIYVNGIKAVNRYLKCTFIFCPTQSIELRFLKTVSFAIGHWFSLIFEVNFKSQYILLNNWGISIWDYYCRYHSSLLTFLLDITQSNNQLSYFREGINLW